MQHESSINTKGQTFADTPILECSFQCVTGEQNIRDLLAEIVEKLNAECPGTESLSRNTEIVLAEVLNNIEEHSYRGHDRGQIKLHLKIFQNRICVETTDFGEPMPGLELPVGRLPDTDVERKSLPEGGFGWFLIHTLAPDPIYKRRGASNTLSITILDVSA